MTDITTHDRTITMLREADRLSRQAAARAATLALCDRIVTTCETRAKRRAALQTAYLPGDVIAIQSIMSRA